MASGVLGQILTMASMGRRNVWLLGTALVLSGCLGRSLPLPPPSVTAQAIEACAPADCPNGGVIVTLEGTAVSGATVIVENLNPASAGPGGELLAVVTRANEAGAWRAVLLPVRDPGGRVRVTQRGDTLSVWQIALGGDASGPRYLTLPRM